MKFSWRWFSYTLTVCLLLSSSIAKNKKAHDDSIETISADHTSIVPPKISSQKDTELEAIGIAGLQTKFKGMQLFPDTLLGAYIDIHEVYANLDTGWGYVQVTDSLTLSKSADGAIQFSFILICGNFHLCSMEGVAVPRDGYLEYRELLDWLDSPEECVLRIRFVGNGVTLEDSTDNCTRSSSGSCGVSCRIDGTRLFKVRRESIVKLEDMEALRETKHLKVQELELLISALKDEYYQVRLKAIQILGEIKDSTAVQLLIGVIKDEKDSGVRSQAIMAYSEARLQAIKALGKAKDPRTVKLLIDATKDEISADVRVLAIDTLGDIKDPKAIPVLIDAIKDEHWHVQWAARRALVDIAGNDFGADWKNWQEWWNKNKPK